jgi:hypothetical protein
MKTKILIAAVFISFLYSCSINNTSDVVVPAPDLVGTWNLTSVTMDDAVLSVTSPVITTLTGSGFGKNLNASLTFTENPNQVVIDGDFVFQLTYKDANGQESTEDLLLDNLFFNDTFGFLSSSWSLENNTLTLSEGGEQLNIRVISFIDDVMKIETDVDKAITVDNVTSTVTGKALLTIEKQ